MEKRINNGIICFSDILGYSNIIENNDIENCSKIIKNIILDLKNKDKFGKKMFDLIGLHNYENSSIQKFFDNNLEILIISDSVIFFFDLDNVENPDNLDINIILALYYIILFFEESFNKGLPMRSCIDYGEYYLYDNIFAGRAIVNSYKLSSQLNISGIVLTDNCYNNILKIDSEKKRITNLLKLMLKDYLVPLKSNVEKRMYVLNWVINKPNYLEKDITQFIHKSFHDHNKNVNLSVIDKLNNTENIIRYLLL